MTIFLSVARDFSPYPAGRFRRDGPNSGERFREDVLVPALGRDRVVLNLDGVMGLPSSFFEEALGGLVRRGLAPEYLKDRLTLVADSQRMKSHPSRGWKYIEDAGFTMRSHRVYEE